ncbi:hypothetical protein VOLCADRAFT_106101 [Volvox carteri f. nagariensis]|uniref:Uncharacterized protein n=1 Tax=Volvox carteri f. nagariensis TaxID=3068 RepID=D8U528_VOLCA|nr:uncharacterized protein VOLCADRAFT_106101 [Volvox carteri f. nagariensis]EFJ45144.1 hypothetical protein VOLCADRAFT_106101 [Volvox carteri f. nagariensis]|eukprot:XP_002953820.1 hypothetical protein VOLCADRAFT_106101 [Volvox carteri f. nagariensis]
MNPRNTNQICTNPSMGAGTDIATAVEVLWCRLQTAFSPASEMQALRGRGGAANVECVDGSDTRYEVLASADPAEVFHDSQMATCLFSANPCIRGPLNTSRQVHHKSITDDWSDDWACRDGHGGGPDSSHGYEGHGSSGEVSDRSLSHVGSDAPHTPETSPPARERHDIGAESALSSVAAPIGSALLGCALGTAAAFTISPFIAAGFGAGVLLLQAPRDPCSTKSSYIPEGPAVGIHPSLHTSLHPPYAMKGSVIDRLAVTRMVKETVSLSQLAAKFPDFDLAGKRMYLDKMGEVSSRYEVFIKRLELSQDPAAREFLRFTTAQMLEGGFTYSQMFSGLKQSLQMYRQWVEHEERVSSDPVEHQKFLQDFRSMWEASFLGRVDLTYLFDKVDPKILLKAQADPQYWVAIKEIASDPGAMRKWLDDPNLGPFVAALWKSMQDKSNRSGSDGAMDRPKYVRVSQTHKYAIHAYDALRDVFYYSQGMREREYIRLIPEDELLRVNGLLRRVYNARGWTNDDESRGRAWADMLAAAQKPEGGAWQLDFDMDKVVPSQLAALCAAVEIYFLGGLLAQQIHKVRRPPLKVLPGEDPRDPYSWLSGLHDDNTIYVNANRWRETISEDNPMNFEGNLCTSKLEALAHALGHELVHAVVLNFFPDIDAKSTAYLPDDKHGPIFMLLNKRLFGHVGHASQRLFNVR